ncbi:hypothetical protein AAVH_08618 [Aphelenchoides avenae]|nr:hypothetical protein AAVH_08618 [Aphelenchus avenae]
MVSKSPERPDSNLDVEDYDILEFSRSDLENIVAQRTAQAKSAWKLEADRTMLKLQAEHANEKALLINESREKLEEARVHFEINEAALRAEVDALKEQITSRPKRARTVKMEVLDEPQNQRDEGNWMTRTACIQEDFNKRLAAKDAEIRAVKAERDRIKGDLEHRIAQMYEEALAKSAELEEKDKKSVLP